LYDNPEDFLDEEERHDEKKRRWCVRRALDLAEEHSSKEERSDMDAEDVVEAAASFYDFITLEPDS